MRPMTMTRARLSAGAAAVCTTLAVVPATASSDPHAAATARATAASARQAPERVKRKQSSLWVQRVRRNVLLGHATTVHGKLDPRRRFRVVRLQLRQPHGWQTVDRALTRTGGRFRLTYRAHRAGTVALRVVFPGDRSAMRARRTLDRVNVFRQAAASWYGTYGGALACGGTLGRDELGVAHKTLPCGTKLTLRYHGRSVRVRVIDRGPYVGGREFDLTGATKRALGFGDLGTVLATK